jgi:hypothetical protein
MKDMKEKENKERICEERDLKIANDHNDKSVGSDTPSPCIVQITLFEIVFDNKSERS